MTQKPASGPGTSSQASVLDPIEWERRVAEARARRASVLASRTQTKKPADPLILTRPGDNRPPVLTPAASAEANIDDEAPRSTARRRSAPLALVFAAGLTAGLALALYLPRESDVPAPPPAAVSPAATATPSEAAPVGLAAVPTQDAPNATAAPPDPDVAQAPATPEDPPSLSAPDADPAPRVRSAAAEPAAATPAAVPARETPTAEAPAPETGPAENATAEDTSADEPPSPAPPAPGNSIVVHVPSGVSRARGVEVVERLRGAGFEATGPVPVDVTVQTSNVRFFRGTDRAGAEAAAAILGDAVVRAFPDLPARPGKLELWLAGTGGTVGQTTVADTPAPAPPAPPAPAAPTPSSTAVDALTIQALVEAARQE